MSFLFVDRILQLSRGKFVRGIKHVSQDDPYLCYDKQGKLCFIPSLVGEALGQLAAWSVMEANGFTMRPVAGLASCARLIRPTYVGETLLLESFIDRLDESVVQYHSVASVGDEVVFTLDGALGPLLPMEDFIDPLEVTRQFNEINRPGEWPLLVSEGSEKLSDNFVPDVVPFVFDRIIACEPGVNLSAEMQCNPLARYFPDHFPRKPVLPMTVLLESKINLANKFLELSSFLKQYKVYELRKIKMKDFILPGDVIICHLSVKSHEENKLVLNFRSEVAGKLVCVLDLVMVLS